MDGLDVTPTGGVAVKNKGPQAAPRVGKAAATRVAPAKGVLSLPFDRLLACTGLWAVFSWVYWFNTTPFSDGVLRGGALLGISSAMFATQLVVAAVWLARRWDRSLRGSDVLCAAGACVCTLSVCAAGFLHTSFFAWPLANTAVAGVCAGIGYLRWTSFFSRLNGRDAVACLFGAYLLSALFKMVLDLLPATAGAAASFALPVAWCWSLRRADGVVAGEPASRAQAVYRRGNYGVLVRVVACVLLFCAARQVVMLGLDASGTRTLGVMASHAVEAVLASGVLVWVFMLGRSLDFPQLWRFVFLFLATAVLVECFAPGNLWGGLLFEVSASFVWMVLWLLVCDVARHAEAHPYVVAAFGWGTYALGNYAGWALFGLLGLDGLGASTGLALVWALGVAMVFLLDTRAPDVQRIFADLHPQVRPEEYRSIDERCARLASEAKLSARELEVLGMLAKGRSRAYMAEELCLSENTVRGHVSRLYGKVGVHSREELYRLLGL